MMGEALFALIAFMLLFFWWDSTRKAADRARELGRNACKAAGVQWLDESVQQIKSRWTRSDSGWLTLERTYRFDYSHDGAERHEGRLVLREGRLVGFVGPTREVVAFQ